MSDYNLFVQRIGLVGITNIFVAISSLIFLPILTKSFSITDYGVWVQIITTIGLVPNIATLGLPYTMVRYLSTEKDKNKISEGFYSISSLVIISTFIISLFLFLFSEYIAVFLLNDNTAVAQLLPFIIFFVCLNTLLINYFRTFQEMKRYSFFLLLQTYMAVFIVSYLAFEGFGIFEASLGLLLANVITFIGMAILIVSQIGFKIPKYKKLKKYLGFGIPTIPNNLSYWIVDSSDRYIIGIMLGSAFVGYYSPAYTLGNLIVMMLAPFSLLLPAILPKYYDSNEFDKISKFLKYSMKYFLLIAIPSAFGLSILSKPLLMILTTENISINSYFVTPFIALSAVLFGIYAIISNIIILKNKTKIIGISWIIAATLNLSLNIIMVPYFGIIGAAMVTLIAYIIAFAITLYYSLKFFKFDFDLIFTIKSVIASILMSIMIILINPNGILPILIVTIISSLLYFALLLALKGITKEEFTFFRELIGN